MPSILAWDRSFLDHWFSTSSYAGNVVFYPPGEFPQASQQIFRTGAGNGSWLTVVWRPLTGEGVSSRFGAVDGLMVEIGVGSARGLARDRPAELSASAVVSRVVVDGVKSLTGAEIDRCLSARSVASSRNWLVVICHWCRFYGQRAGVRLRSISCVWPDQCRRYFQNRERVLPPATIVDADLPDGLLLSIGLNDRLILEQVKHWGVGRGDVFDTLRQ